MKHPLKYDPPMSSAHTFSFGIYVFMRLVVCTHVHVEARRYSQGPVLRNRPPSCLDRVSYSDRTYQGSYAGWPPRPGDSPVSTSPLDAPAPHFFPRDAKGTEFRAPGLQGKHFPE